MDMNRPKTGMRVIYGRSGFKRSGFRGVVVNVTTTTFKVEWDELKEDPTTYTMQAWATTQFRDTLRDRDRHYIFLDEKITDSVNKLSDRYPTNPCEEIFLLPNQQCTLNNEEEQEIMKKTMIKQTIINGIVIQDATDDALIRVISELEANICRLKAIKANSVKIKAMITERKQAIEEVVAELDTRV